MLTENLYEETASTCKKLLIFPDEKLMQALLCYDTKSLQPYLAVYSPKQRDVFNCEIVPKQAVNSAGCSEKCKAV